MEKAKRPTCGTIFSEDSIYIKVRANIAGKRGKKYIDSSEENEIKDQNTSEDFIITRENLRLRGWRQLRNMYRRNWVTSVQRVRFRTPTRRF